MKALIALPVLALALAACETVPEKPSESAGTLYEVRADFTPFYRIGPQQPMGPDLSLEKGRLLTLVKRGYGYSRVQLENGQAGFVATSDIAPAPPPMPGMPATDFSAPSLQLPTEPLPQLPMLPESGAPGEGGPTDLPEFRY